MAHPASFVSRADRAAGRSAALTLAAGLLLALAGAPAPARAAGVVTVNFLEPSRYADAGRRDRFDDAPTLAALAKHLEQLGTRRLPEGQTLAVDVLDVDLAGEFRPTSRGLDLRVLRGAADWPRLKLRYVLSENGKELDRGEDSLSDLDYLNSTLPGASSDTLAHEKRLLDDWFTRRFATPANASR